AALALAPGSTFELGGADPVLNVLHGFSSPDGLNPVRRLACSHHGTRALDRPPSRPLRCGSVCIVPRTYGTELIACTCIRKVIRAFIRTRRRIHHTHTHLHRPWS